MGIVLDVIIIAIILLNIIICYKKGLVKLAVGLVAVIISLILAMMLYKPVSNIIIKNTEIDEKIKESIINTLTSENKEAEEDNSYLLEHQIQLHLLHLLILLMHHYLQPYNILNLVPLVHLLFHVFYLYL